MNKKVKILIAFQILVVLLLFYAYFLQALVTNATKLDAAFTAANTYSYASEILTQRIENRFPPQITDNFFLNAIFTRLTEAIITPERIRNASQKPLERIVKAVNEEGRIKDNKVVIDTSKYKTQALNEVSNWNFAPRLEKNAAAAINSIPDSVTLVDLEKNPNSVFGLIVKARNYINWLKVSVIILTLLLITLVISTLYLLTSNKRLIFRVYGWFFLISGLGLAVLSYLLPWLIANFYYVSNPISDNLLTRNLIIDLSNYYLTRPGAYAISFLFIGVVLLLFSWEKFYNQVKNFAKKISDRYNLGRKVKKNNSKKKK